MTAVLSSVDEKERLHAHRARGLEAAIEDLIALQVAGDHGAERQAARERLGWRLAELLALTDLLGRRRVLLAAAHAPTPFAQTWPTDALPALPFAEAVEQLVARHPTIIFGLPIGASPAAAVAEVYATGGFTMARATDLRVVGRVQRLIADALERGTPRPTAVRAIEELGPFTKNYAATVYENAVSTAYTAGTFRQMRSPDVRRVIGAIRFDSIPDTRRSDICKAFHGTLAPADHPIWNKRSPPCHHRCRSGPTFMDWARLRREGSIRDGDVVPYIPNPEVQPATGFGRRPDVEIYMGGGGP